MDGSVAWVIGSVVAAFIVGFKSVWDKAAEAKAEAAHAAETTAELSTAHSVTAVKIQAHESALNGGMTERIRGVVAQELMKAGIVTPNPPPLPALPGAVQARPVEGTDSTAARIAELRAALAEAEAKAGGAHG